MPCSESFLTLPRLPKNLYSWWWAEFLLRDVSKRGLVNNRDTFILWNVCHMWILRRKKTNKSNIKSPNPLSDSSHIHCLHFFCFRYLTKWSRLVSFLIPSWHCLVIQTSLLSFVLDNFLTNQPCRAFFMWLLMLLLLSLLITGIHAMIAQSGKAKARLSRRKSHCD